MNVLYKVVANDTKNESFNSQNDDCNNQSNFSVASTLPLKPVVLDIGSLNNELEGEQKTDNHINNDGHSEAPPRASSFNNELPVIEPTIVDMPPPIPTIVPVVVLIHAKPTHMLNFLTCCYIMSCGPCFRPNDDPYFKSLEKPDSEITKQKTKKPWLNLKNCSPKNYCLSISMPKCKPPTCISFKCPPFDCFKSKQNSDVSTSKDQTKAATKSNIYALTGQLVADNNDDKDCLNPELLWTCFGNETQQEVSNNAIENIDYSNCIIIDYDPFKQCSDMTEFAYATTTTCVIDVSNQCPDPTEITCPDVTEYTRCFNELEFPDLSPFFQCFADNTLDSISNESSNEDNRLHNQEDTRHYMAYLFCCCIGIISFCKQSNPSSHNLKCATDSISVLNFLNLCSNKCNTQSCDNFKQYLECCTIQPCTSAPMNCVRYVKSCSSDCNDTCCDALSSCCVKIKRSFCTPPDCDIPNPIECVSMFFKCAYGCFCKAPYNCISNAC